MGGDMSGPMDVGIVTVGDELLAGDTVNTNATWLCARLYERGVMVTRVTVVPDDVEEIVSVVRHEHERSDAVIVTGGLGPTHDDITLDAIATALDRPLETNEEAMQWLTREEGYAADDLVAGTVDIPVGARPLHNEVGVAPGAKVDGVYVFPGVPTEMQAMFRSVEEDFTGQPTVRRTVTVDEPESQLLDRFAALQEQFEVSVGSYPGDVVDVTISGSDVETVETAAAWLAERSSTVSPEDEPGPGDRHDDTSE